MARQHKWHEVATRLLGVFLALVGGTRALSAQNDPDWTEPFPPFRIAGNLYYVGSKGLANYLITTPQGHILINSDLEANVPLIRASIEKLGFKFSDIKILLISHAHWDHDAGSAMIKRLTGAKYMVMDADVPVVESGGKTDFQYGKAPLALSAGESRSRAARRRRSEARRRGARRASHARAHQGLHDVDDEGEGGREDLRRGDHRQPERERRLQARRQCRSIRRSPRTTSARSGS